MRPDRWFLLVLFTLLFICSPAVFAQDSVAECANVLLATKDEAARAAWLAAHPAALTPALAAELLQRGEAAQKQRTHPQTEAAFAAGLAVTRRLADKAGQARCLRGLGQLQYDLARYPQAAEFYRQSLELARAAADRASESRALQGLGQVKRLLGASDEALRDYQAALALAEPLGDEKQLAGLFNGLAVVTRGMGRLDAATDYIQRALALYDRLDDKEARAGVRLNLGDILYARGLLDEALTTYQRGLALSEQLQERRLLGMFYNQLGTVELERNNLGAAQDYLEKSLPLKRAAGDQRALNYTLTNLGLLYYRLNDFNKALEYYRQAQTSQQQSGETPALAALFINIGSVYQAQGEHAAARAQYQQALQLADTLKRGDLRAEAVQHLAEIAYDSGQKVEAWSLFEQSLALTEQSGSPYKRLRAYGNLAMYYYLEDRPADALRMFERAITLTAEKKLGGELWFDYAVAGAALHSLKRLDEAHQMLDKSLALLEAMRGELGGGQLAEPRFLRHRLLPYFELMSLALTEAQPVEALAYAEQAKARVLFDLLQHGRADVSKSMTETERVEERRLNEAMSALNVQRQREQMRPQPAAARLSELDAQLAEARLAYETNQDTLFAAHPDLRVQRGMPPPFTLATAAALLPDERTALLEYVVRDHETFLFVVTRAPQPALQVFRLPLTGAQVQMRVREFRALLAARNLNFVAMSGQLYDELLKPAAALLRGKTQLVLVPDNALWELPFEALRQTGGAGKPRYLLEDFTLARAPSLTVLVEMQKLRARRGPRPHDATLLALGNPAWPATAATPATSSMGESAAALRALPTKALPQAETEVKALARLYGAAHSRIYTGAAAREDRFKAEAADADVIHLAAHGLLNDAGPLYSQIVLAQDTAGVIGPVSAGEPGNSEDGLLEAWELMKLDLRADLVVLSACETGRGAVIPGEGVLGLSWALFIAGAPTVVVSQWQVDADATTALMIEFHRQLRQASAATGTLTKAAALRTAALKLLRGPYRHPFYWAGFVAVGAAN
ncbi:MAG: CHAT domain-containing protein [Acidobacteria bacterium]|nr:CHAT domain-containing protein [Acidobacteriota bacterium]MBI3426922.1 CHAT domain-containing protein [Acidobacteriota bacterium]